MDADAAWRVLAAERRAFADLLDTLTPEQWETPSLCGAWNVREVATHMMVGPAGSVGSFLTAMIVARGRFAIANQVMVRRRSSRPTTEIADDFRRLADDRFTPPTMDWHAPLTDFLVHRLDVTVPLALPTRADSRTTAAWVEVLTFIASPKAEGVFRPAALPDVALRATDVDWGHGAGPAAEAPAEVLALALTGRPHRLDEVDGPGAAVLREWAGGRM